jgi:hypothetical protein
VACQLRAFRIAESAGFRPMAISERPLACEGDELRRCDGEISTGRWLGSHDMHTTFKKGLSLTASRPRRTVGGTRSVLKHRTGP